MQHTHQRSSEQDITYCRTILTGDIFNISLILILILWVNFTDNTHILKILTAQIVLAYGFSNGSSTAIF